MKPDLTDEETDALVRLLRDAIDADHYPFSPTAAPCGASN